MITGNWMETIPQFRFPLSMWLLKIKNFILKMAVLISLHQTQIQYTLIYKQINQKCLDQTNSM